MSIAFLWIGPTQSSRVHLRCCSEVQRWERRAGEWVFRYRIVTSCA